MNYQTSLGQDNNEYTPTNKGLTEPTRWLQVLKMKEEHYYTNKLIYTKEHLWMVNYSRKLYVWSQRINAMKERPLTVIKWTVRHYELQIHSEIQ